LDLERELARIRQSGVPGGVAMNFEKASFAVGNQRQALAESTDRLKIAELGYRYFHADYTDAGFPNDLAQSGIYTGVNIKF